MKKERVIISCLVILLTTLILLTGVVGRINFEGSSRYAFVAADMKELQEYQLNTVEELQRFRDAGSHVVKVHPLTMKGLQESGRLDLISYSSLSINQDVISQQIRAALGSYPMKAENLIAVVTDPALQGFLGQELSYRYTDYTSAFLEDGTTMVIAFQNLTQENDLIVGYDYKELELIAQACMKAAVVYPSYTFENPVYSKYFKEFVSGNGVSFIIVRDNPYDNRLPMTEEFQAVLRNLDVTMVLMENENQIGNEIPPLAGEFFPTMKYRTIRGFTIDKIVPNDNTLYRYRYHQWFNSAIERNTVFIDAGILKNPDITKEENIQLTLRAIADFTGNMRGYQFSGTRPETPYVYGEETMAMAGGILLLSLVYLYLMLILKKTPAYFTEGYFGLMIVSAILSYALAPYLTGLYALGIMIVSSALISAALFRLDRKLERWKKLMWMLICAAAIVFVGIVAISALLGGMEFYLSVKLFRGVVISLLFPLLIAAVNGYLIYYSDTLPIKKIPAYIWEHIKKINRWILVLVGTFGLLFVVYYLIRSGKSNLLLPVEDQFRKWLSDTFYIRPRLKEFLFGYPAFTMFLYVAYHNKTTAWRFFLGIGATILFTSVFNTFCHTFTAVTVSLQRIFNGFLCGLIVSALVLGIVFFIRYLMTLPKKQKEEKEESAAVQIEETLSFKEGSEYPEVKTVIPEEENVPEKDVEHTEEEQPIKTEPSPRKKGKKSSKYHYRGNKPQKKKRKGKKR